LFITNKKHKCSQTRAYGLQATLQYGRKMTKGKAILRLLQNISWKEEEPEHRKTDNLISPDAAHTALC